LVRDAFLRDDGGDGGEVDHGRLLLVSMSPPEMGGLNKTSPPEGRFGQPLKMSFSAAS
jgi:hypothetical protein